MFCLRCLGCSKKSRTAPEPAFTDIGSEPDLSVDPKVANLVAKLAIQIAEKDQELIAVKKEHALECEEHISRYQDIEAKANTLTQRLEEANAKLIAKQTEIDKGCGYIDAHIEVMQKVLDKTEKSLAPAALQAKANETRAKLGQWCSMCRNNQDTTTYELAALGCGCCVCRGCLNGIAPNAPTLTCPVCQKTEVSRTYFRIQPKRG